MLYEEIKVNPFLGIALIVLYNTSENSFQKLKDVQMLKTVQNLRNNNIKTTKHSLELLQLSNLTGLKSFE